MDSSDSDEEEYDDEIQCYNCQVDIDEYEDDAYYDLDLDKHFCKTCYYFIQDNK